MSKYFLFTKEIKPKRIQKNFPQSGKLVSSIAKVDTHLCVAANKLQDGPIR